MVVWGKQHLLMFKTVSAWRFDIVKKGMNEHMKTLRDRCYDLVNLWWIFVFGVWFYFLLCLQRCTERLGGLCPSPTCSGFVISTC